MFCLSTIHSSPYSHSFPSWLCIFRTERKPSYYFIFTCITPTVAFTIEDSFLWCCLILEPKLSSWTFGQLWKFTVVRLLYVKAGKWQAGWWSFLTVNNPVKAWAALLLMVEAATAHPDSRMWKQAPLFGVCQGHTAEEHMGWQILSRIPWKRKSVTYCFGRYSAGKLWQMEKLWQLKSLCFF